MKALNIFGIGVLAATFFILAKSKKDETPTEDYTDPATPTAIPTTIDQGLVLKLGSKGEEVKRLQSLMGITGKDADGIFGPQTEYKLLKLKGVKAITIKQFLSSPTLNQNILKPGTNVMAKLKLGTRIFDAEAKVDTSYFSNYKVVKTVPYGQEIGKIRSANPAGNWYSVYYKTFLGTEVGFVLATDVEKY
jgi:peptidoglycan hydrolase-like protein with peptidoglycan-binding domain